MEPCYKGVIFVSYSFSTVSSFQEEKSQCHTFLTENLNLIPNFRNISDSSWKSTFPSNKIRYLYEKASISPMVVEYYGKIVIYSNTLYSQ